MVARLLQEQWHRRLTPILCLGVSRYRLLDASQFPRNIAVLSQDDVSKTWSVRCESPADPVRSLLPSPTVHDVLACYKDIAQFVFLFVALYNKKTPVHRLLIPSVQFFFQIYLLPSRFSSASLHRSQFDCPQGIAQRLGPKRPASQRMISTPVPFRNSPDLLARKILSSRGLDSAMDFQQEFVHKTRKQAVAPIRKLVCAC